MEYRYRDKLYLSTYLLDTELFDLYDFLVEDAAPIRSVYILKTNEGAKILKKVDYTVEELMFIYEGLNIIRRRYPYVVNFRVSKTGKPYVEYENGIYVVLDIIEGRECVFENPIDLKNAADALGRFHIAGENIDAYTKKRFISGQMIDRVTKRMNDMIKYKDVASMHINKCEFDRLYLECADYYIEKTKETIECLESSCYKTLSEVTHTLCHHDLAHHNILMGNDDNVYFIDFDYSVIDLPYHDISNMITKAVKYSCWSIELADTVMEAYTNVKPMSREEIEVLYGYLMFPKDFYDIATSYYMRTRSWDEGDFVEKLKRKAAYQDDRERFLKDFKEKWINA